MPTALKPARAWARARRRARRATSTSSFANVCVRWVSTVRWVTNSSCAIWRFVRPSAASVATRRSAGVSASRPGERGPARPRAGGVQLRPRALGEPHGAALVGEMERLAQRLARRLGAAAPAQRRAEVHERAHVLEPRAARRARPRGDSAALAAPRSRRPAARRARPRAAPRPATSARRGARRARAARRPARAPRRARPAPSAPRRRTPASSAMPAPSHCNSAQSAAAARASASASRGRCCARRSRDAGLEQRRAHQQPGLERVRIDPREHRLRGVELVALDQRVGAAARPPRPSESRRRDRGA